MDKQIKEIGADISIAWQKANHRRCTMGVTRPPLCDVLAEELAKMSYRKIPEGAVVLTREEYDGKSIIVEMSGGHKLKLSVGTLGEMSKILEEKARKETADTFADKVNTIINNCKKSVGMNDYVVDAERMVFEVNQIRKEFTNKEL